MFFNFPKVHFGDILITIASILMLFSGGKRRVNGNLGKILLACIPILLICIFINPWLALLLSSLFAIVLEKYNYKKATKSHMDAIENARNENILNPPNVSTTSTSIVGQPALPKEDVKTP